MAYRTKTYIAAEWEGDSNLVEALRTWSESGYWGLHFLDAHELGESRDSSLNCTIKSSLGDRLAHSKTFVLIVGDNTLSANAGSCVYCADYSGYSHSCRRGHKADFRSYIKCECEYAARNIDRIVVLYNNLSVDRSKCPEALRYRGIHIPAICKRSDGVLRWDYQKIKDAIEG